MPDVKYLTSAPVLYFNLVPMKNYVSRNPVFVAVAFSTCVYIALFIFALFIPLPYQYGGAVSPLLVQPSNDIFLYLKAVQHLFGQQGETVPETGGDFPDLSIIGPGFPFLLYITSYGEGNTLPLALLFVGFGIAFSAIWIWWMAACGVTLPFLLLFALVPNPLWFSISVSSDMPFALLFGAFFVLYTTHSSSWRWPLLACLALLACLTRPVGFGLIVLVMADYILFRLSRNGSRPSLRVTVVTCALLGVTMIGFYLNWHYFELMLAKSHGFRYFGYATYEYYEGLFDNLPDILNYPLSWLAVLAAKTLYFLGVRPISDYYDPSFINVFLRSWSSYILLIGFVSVFVIGKRAPILVVAILTAPMLVSLGHERYVLPILPILFAYAALVIQRGYHRLVPERARASRADGS